VHEVIGDPDAVERLRQAGAADDVALGDLDLLGQRTARATLVACECTHVMTVLEQDREKAAADVAGGAREKDASRDVSAHTTGTYPGTGAIDPLTSGGRILLR